MLAGRQLSSWDKRSNIPVVLSSSNSPFRQIRFDSLCYVQSAWLGSSPAGTGVAHCFIHVCIYCRSKNDCRAQAVTHVMRRKMFTCFFFYFIFF